ncbi:hypothetical protein H5410_054426 [Solanum commersonii]|uniref:F-box domain-containing protein n=1 Tax=Solanum commersonii TaxID=4109 RepID=A0A9J5WGD5_SOLCO|nr:hypothetical protein H5410_054426 [Solanum commersonii]
MILMDIKLCYIYSRGVWNYPVWVLAVKCYVMPPKGRKHCRKLPPDFLSDLPDNVIDVILMCLPCKEAVRTSILSMKWRYHWCRITELNLDSHLWETKMDKLYPTVKFTKIIYQILSLHEGPITKFSLDIAVLKSCPNINNFIHFLSRNDIQQLVLELPWGKMYNLPSSLFTFSLLSHLTLHNCIIHPPLDFQGFDKLISLKLCDVTISPELLGSLISQCPLLDKLELEISEDSLSDVIEINAPKLRSFDFTGNITFICLMNVPLLAEVSLSLYQGSSMEADNFFFAMFFESCTALERLFLHFNGSEIQPEDDDEVATRLPFDVNCVKYLYLRFLFLEESYDLSHVLCCIRSFPYLEYLEIQVGFGDDGIIESLELEHFTDLTLNHLREIKLGETLFHTTAYFLQLLSDHSYMMPPKARKLRRSLVPDALSYLPDNIIDVILMCLPSKDAVRTSILSKKWRYHWCRLTKLELDESLWITKKDLLNPTVKFRKIMYQFLSLHEGPITKFTLDVVHLASCPEIDNFIYFLSRNDIQHLALHLPLRKEYKLSSLLFTCSQLRHLSLCYCSIQHPSAFQGFDKLISLNLCEVNISSELLESLISHCPLLEELELDIANKSDTIEINAPMLRSFDLSGNISSVCLKNVPCLVKVLLYGDYIKAEDLDFAKLFECCPALEHLLFFSLDSGFSAGAGYEAPTRLPFNLNSVKRFTLPDIMLVESYKLSYALCLIRSFPYLEYLEIQVHEYGDYEDDEDEPIPEPLELKHLSDVTFNHLKEVKLGCLTGTTSELLLIKFLLAESPVLERMLIDRQYLDHEHLDKRLQIFAEISNFSRASPKAEVIYIDLGGSLA